MERKHRKLFDFEKKVTDALLAYDPMEFIQASKGRDLVLDPKRAQDFLRDAIEKFEDLYEESKSL